MRSQGYIAIIFCVIIIITFTNSLPALDLGWNQIATVPPNPGELTFTEGIYDSFRDQYIEFGGGKLDLSLVTNKVWSLNCTTDTWTDISPAGGDFPEIRASSVTVFDSLVGRMIVFGGNDLFNSYNDLWEFDLDSHTWNEIVPVNTPPSLRTCCCGIFDPQGNRLLIFGGFKDGILFPIDLNELWEFSFRTFEWKDITPSGDKPSPRSYASAVYDSVNNRMVVFGGFSGRILVYDEYQDTWTFEFNTDEFVDRTNPVLNPSDRSAHAAVYDAFTQRMFIFGGGAVVGTSFKNDVWSLGMDDFTWVEETVAGAIPDKRSAMAYAFDTVRRRMLIFGGHSRTVIVPTLYDETWELTISDPLTIPAQNPTSIIFCLIILGFLITGLLSHKAELSGAKRPLQ